MKPPAVAFQCTGLAAGVFFAVFPYSLMTVKKFNTAKIYDILFRMLKKTF